MSQNALLGQSWIKGHKSPYQLGDITHHPDWGALTVCDAWFNNLTSGLMICAALAWGTGGPLMAWLLPFALSLAFGLLLIDLVLLVADLGDPGRFINSLRVMKFTSPLSVGVWALSCYGFFLALALIFTWILFGVADWQPSIGLYITGTLMRLFTVLALISAIVVICYKGVVFSCSSQPGLCQARWLAPFFVADSLLMGMSAFAIISCICSPNQATTYQLVTPMIFLLVARCVTFALLWQDVKKRARVIIPEDRNHLIGFIVYGAAGILPLFLLFFGPVFIFLAALLCLAAGFFERNWAIKLTRPFK